MRRLVTVSLVLLLLVGCSSKRKGGVVHGKVTYKGQAVNGASLTLVSTGADGTSFSIGVSQEGTFSTADVPPGDYKIVVLGNTGAAEADLSGVDPAKRAQVKEKLEKMKGIPTIKYPDKYKSHLTTPLTRTITKGGQELNLELTD
jgi:hypothetical protein